MKSKKNLLVIVNGFDLALGLKSKFSDYMKIYKYCRDNKKIKSEIANNKLSQQDTGLKSTDNIKIKNKKLFSAEFRKDKKDHNYNSENLKMFKASYKFGETLYLFSEFYDKFTNKFIELKDIFYKGVKSGSLKNRLKDYYNKDRVKTAFNFIAQNFLNLKLWSSKFKLKFELDGKTFVRTFKCLDERSQDKAIDLIRSINKLSSRYSNKLSEVTSNINSNVWELLIIARKYQVDRISASNLNISNFNNWYDIENMIYMFTVAKLDQQRTLNKNIMNGFNKFLSYKEYFDNDSSSDKSFFKLSLAINDGISFFNYLFNINYKTKILDTSYIMNNFINLHKFDNFVSNKYSNNINSQICECFIYILVNNFSKNKFYSQTNYFQFLYGQLKEFEQNFKNYLNDCIDEYPSNEYDNKSFNTLRRISYNASKNKTFNVFDFNYTLVKLDNDCVRHIHGSINNNVVIGISNDAMWKYKSSNLYIFSKAYQIMSLTKFSNKIDHEFFEKIDNVVFFGHSFNDNDLSYFDALFDKIDLYNNSVRLVFCYSKHGKYSINNIKDKQVENAIKLLEHYSKSMANKYHGRSLISKLLLDNRLKFCNVTGDIDKLN